LKAVLKTSFSLNPQVQPSNGAEFLSGLRKTDKLKPVVTLVVYFGADDWDGPRSLKDMLEETSEAVLKHVNDCNLNLIVPREILDFTKFSSDLGKVLHYIAVSESLEGVKQLAEDPAFMEVGNESVRLINECTGSNIPIEEEERKTNMCKGLADWKEELLAEGITAGKLEGRQEGRLEGKCEGRLESQLEMISKKLKKGKSVQVIAEEMEEEPDEIERICKVIEECGVESPIETIVEAVMSRVQN